MSRSDLLTFFLVKDYYSYLDQHDHLQDEQSKGDVKSHISNMLVYAKDKKYDEVRSHIAPMIDRYFTEFDDLFN